MLTVYVKHYLTLQGIEYFEKQWFPKVHSILSQQIGFISLTYSLDRAAVENVDITLKFKDEETFDAWVEIPIHDVLLKELDAYRSRDYFEAARTEDEQVAPSSLEWTSYTVSP